MQLKKLLTTAVSVSIMTSGIVASNASLLSSLVGNMTPTAFACSSSSSTEPCAVNNANVSSVTADPNSNNDSATVSDILCYTSDVSTAITDAKTSIRNLDANTYVVTITNAGSSVLHKADFTFTYDNTQLENLTSPIPSQGYIGSDTFTPTGTTTVYSNTLNGLNVAAGASMTLTFSGSVTGLGTGTINMAFNITPLDDRLSTYSYLSACPAVDTNTANNASSDNTTISQQADLSLVKTSSGGSSSVTNAEGQFIAGSNGSYTLTATNNGPSLAGQPITIVDVIPAQLTYTGYTGTNWTCSYAGFSTLTVTCTNPNNLSNGSSTAVTLSVDVKNL